MTICPLYKSAMLAKMGAGHSSVVNETSRCDGRECTIYYICHPNKPIITKLSKDVEAEVKFALDRAPVEDGYSHAIEPILISAISTQPIVTQKWLRHLVEDESAKPYVVSAVVKCLGRLPDEIPLYNEEGTSLRMHGDGMFLTDIISKALYHKDLEVRDSAVSALEHNIECSIDVLKKYVETETVKYLKEYAQKIIEQNT